MGTGTTTQLSGRHEARLRSMLSFAARLTVEVSVALAVRRTASRETAITWEAAAVLASVLAGELVARAVQRLRPWLDAAAVPPAPAALPVVMAVAETQYVGSRCRARDDGDCGSAIGHRTIV